MKGLIRIGLLATLFFSVRANVAAQAVDAASSVDINSIRQGRHIGEACHFSFVPASDDLITAYAGAHFDTLRPIRRKISVAEVNRSVLLRFSAFNSHDTSSGICFFPGFYFNRLSIYQHRDGRLVPYPTTAPDFPDSMGIRYFEIPPHDTLHLVVRLEQLKTYNSVIAPRLIRKEFLASYMKQQAASQDDIDQMTYVFCGLLLMMILFSVATFLIGANREFLFYAGYALMLGFMLFTKSHYNFRITPISYFFESYGDFILFCIGYGFYMMFMIYFIETRKKHPFLHKLYRYSILAILLAMVVFSCLHFLSSNYAAENFVENFTKFFLLAMAIVFMVYSARRWEDKLLRYLFWGNLFLLVFSVISQVFILLPGLRSVKGIFGASLFYYELGIFTELIFFLIGLAYKNRRQIILQTREKERLKIENERKEFEKQMAVMAAHQEERDRISADMHDELGSGMTTIRLMSEIAKNKMKNDVPVELEKISQSANDVLNKMNAIIWSMNSGNDSLDNLISYIRAYSLEYFEGTPVNCRVDTPQQIPDIVLSGDKRRNIFLCVKESLNNVLKHADAREVKVAIQTEKELVIHIKDNGIGIDLENTREFGNGLKNITKRMEKIGGRFTIHKNGGTTTSLYYPL